MSEQHWTIVNKATGQVLAQVITPGGHPRFYGWDWDPGTQVARMTARQGDPASEIFDGDEWQPNLAAYRARRWTSLKADRDAAVDGGCETPLGRVDSDPESRVKISGAVQLAMLSPEFSIAWTMEDNSSVNHDAAAMIALGIAVGQHVAQCHATAQSLRSQLEAANSIAEIEAVRWPI